MVIFNSFVCLPEGTAVDFSIFGMGKWTRIQWAPTEVIVEKLARFQRQDFSQFGHVQIQPGKIVGRFLFRMDLNATTHENDP